MLKFAYLINVPGQNPETYSKVYENEESRSIIAGTDNMEQAKEYAGKLVADGFTLLDLCGDFDDEITGEMAEAAGAAVKIRHAGYLPAESAKVEALEEFTRYGVIISMKGVEEPVDLELECKDLYTHVIFVKDLEQAAAAAEKLAGEKVHDIELCSWFDKEKTEAIVKAVDGVCPVGSCGL